MEADNLTPVVFVHGAWLSSGSWENFSTYFGNRGYPVSAPEWPRKEADVPSSARTRTRSRVWGSPRSSTTTSGRSARSTSRRC